MEANYLLGVLQEAAAEVIQAVSKLKRFGADEIQPPPKGNGLSNKEKLEEEIMQLLSMISWLDDEGIISIGDLYEEEIQEIFQKKKDKVLKYYNLFRKDDG